MSMIQTSLLSLARRGGLNVGTGERAVSALLGWKLVGAGLRRRSAGGFALLGLGALLLRRAASGHSAIYERMGVVLDGAGRDGGWVRPVHLGTSLVVHRPPSVVAAFFRDHERVAEALGEIRVERGGAQDAPRTWTVRLPGGRQLSSRVRVREEGDDRGLAWETTPGSGIRHEGTLRFVERGGGEETIVVLEAHWHAPIAPLAAGANLWARTALRRIRARIEAGEVPVARAVSARTPAATPRRAIAEGRSPAEDVVEEAGIESFPASDPPAWTPGETKAPSYEEETR